MPHRNHYLRDVEPSGSIDHSGAERALLRRTLLGVVDRLAPAMFPVSAWSLLQFVRDAADVLGIDPAADDMSSLDLSFSERRVADSPSVLLNVVADLRRMPLGRRIGALDRRIAWLAATLRLDQIETVIVGILARYTLFEGWQKLMRALPGSHMPTVTRLAALTGHRASAIDARVGHGGRQIVTGLIRRDNDGSLSPGGFLQRLAAMQASTPPRSPREWYRQRCRRRWNGMISLISAVCRGLRPT